MRLTALTLIGALGLVATTAVSARAAPVIPTPDAHQAPGIVQVWGGCGPWAHPVPGHWSRFRGWIPPHCVRNFYGGYGGYYGGGFYGGGYPYWHHRYYWGY